MADETAMLSPSGGLERIDRDHPLYAYLSRLNHWGAVADPAFEFEAVDSAHGIYICEEVTSRSRVVCKFFSARPLLPPEEARHIMAYEWFCLRRTRLLGLRSPPFQVVRPLGTRSELGSLLVEEYVPGSNLDHYIGRAAHEGEGDILKDRLELLAGFFARLHSLSVWSKPPRLSRTCSEFRSIVRGLDEVGDLSHRPLSVLNHLCDKWESLRSMWDGYTSLVHGDATPTNFIFDDNRGVTAIDLERMHIEDPVYDVGLLVAELKHHFALRILRSEAAEPYIAHFLHAYARYSSLTEAHFDWLAFRSRFYMALGELRIARNPWLPREHRNWLVAEAGRCLQR